MRLAATPGAKVFEYGMGGSTLFFLDNGCRVTSVDHDAQWSEKLRSTIGVHERWTSFLAPPEEISSVENNVRCVSEWPGYEGHDFSQYVHTINRYSDAEFDVVLVDGRARPAALETAAPKVRRGGLLILDNAERQHYQGTVDKLLSRGWHGERFRGPGPYVKSRFWDTLVMRAP